MAARELLRNIPEINRILQTYKLTLEREATLLCKYTETVTRELVFAADLMGFVMTQRNLDVKRCPYLHCFDSRGIESEFDNQMKRFVELNMASPGRALRVVEEYLEQDRISFEDFKSLVLIAAFRAEAKAVSGNRRYNSYLFVSFCIMTAQMCASAYQNGMPQAPRFGLMIMCRTFNNFVNRSVFSPGDPWEEIKFVAHSYSFHQYVNH